MVNILNKIVCNVYLKNIKLHLFNFIFIPETTTTIIFQNFKRVLSQHILRERVFHGDGVENYD